MPLYNYVGADGKLKSVEASSPNEAMSKAPGIAKNSGVSLATSGAGTGTNPQSGRADLQFGAGAPASTLMQGNAQSQQIAQTADPYTKFNENLMVLMQRQQTMGTKRFAEQGFNAQKAQNDRVLAKTDSSLVGASPGTQNSVRSASAGALDPTIGQASRAQQTFSEQIQGFGNAIDSAKGLITAYQARQDKERDDARAVIKDALTLGGAESLNGLAPEELAQLEKISGYPKGYVSGLAQTIKEREMEVKRQQAADRAATTAGLTAGQRNTALNTIVSQQNRSPLILAADRTPVLTASISNARNNPTNAAYQLNLVYSYIQALDTYQSAVREGELGLVSSIDSRVGALSNEVQKIQNGQVVRPEVVRQIATAAESIVTTIKDAARAKAASFQAQAEVMGVGEEYRQYSGGFDASYNTQAQTSQEDQFGQEYEQLFGGQDPGLLLGGYRR